MMRALGLVLVLAAAAAPFGGDYALRLATTAAMYAALALSWNLVGGLAGYPSFATAAFFGTGAYAGALAQGAGWGRPLGLLTGMAAAALFASLIGPLILRLRGHYFAVASLVLAPVLREVINAADGITGGGMGLSLKVAAGADAAGAARWSYALTLGLAAALAGGTAVIRRSRLGWALRCVQQNEDAASVLGVDALLAKATAISLSAAGAGFAGAVYAGWLGYIDPTDVFDDLLSIKPIVMVLLGGAGGAAGPIGGALAFLVLDELVWRNFLSIHEGLLGLLVVGLIIFLPGGLRTTRWPWRKVIA
jgi:branched-chain amino acid transport system permease protein